MPIANCHISNEEYLIATDAELLVAEWASLIPTNPDHISINFVKVIEQLAKRYELMVHLYLPFVWKSEEVEKIQLTLLQVLTRYLKINSDEIFVMTSIIQSTHVIENGEIQRW